MEGQEVTNYLSEQESSLSSLLLRNENTPARVGVVQFNGQVHTKDVVLSPAIERITEAETFGDVLKEVDELGRYLERLDIFKSITARIDKDPDYPGELIVYVEVEEKGRLALKTETHLRQEEGDVAVSGTVRNLFGCAERVSGTYSIGTRSATSYQLNFTRPLYDESKSFDVSAFKTTNDLQAFSSCHEIATGLTGNFQSTGLHLSQHANYTLVWREVLNLSPSASWSIRDASGHTLKSSLAYTTTFDKTDHSAVPARGYLVTASEEWAGLGGDVSFLKTRLEAKWWLPLFSKLTLSSAVQCGLLNPFGESKVPLSDRFYLGGPTSLRGFSMKGVGPRHGVDSLGGEVMLAGGAALRTRLSDVWGGWAPWAYAHVFCNAGCLAAYNREKSTWGNIEQMATSSPRVSVGVGLLASLGMARIEANFCWLLRKERSDAGRDGFQLGVGIDFLS